MATQSKKPSGPDLAVGVPASDLADGGLIGGHVGDEAVLLARQGEEIFALSARCTHYGGPLGKGVLADDTVRCPWHHACFSLRTGEAIRAPAFDPVARWRTELVGGRIYVREKLQKGSRPPAVSSGNRRTVIVGGGAAGFAAAERLRRLGFDGEITIVSAEDSLPVDRPNLSKDYLAGKAPEDWVFVKPRSFFDEQAITLELGTRVGAIDPAKREVTLEGGRSHPFDRLLIATGAEPLHLHIPGADRPRVFTLRSLADSKAIIAAADSSKAAVVIGASFIGLEVAASLITRGLKVHVVAPEPKPLVKVLGDALGDFIRAEHEAHGVVFHLRRKPASIEERHVILDDGTRLDADLVVMGVGVRPRIDLAKRAGLHIDRGVIVNELLETNAPGVFAAGDIARLPDALFGGSLRVEHWVFAERLGQIAAVNMLGGAEKFAQAPFFWSQHYDIPINYVGHAESWDSVEVDGNPGAHDCLVRYRKGGRVLAVASIYRDEQSLRAELDMEMNRAAA